MGPHILRKEPHLLRSNPLLAGELSARSHKVPATGEVR